MLNDRIIYHSNISDITCDIINTVLGNDNKAEGSQCFGVATLGVLALRKGEHGRKYFLNYLELMRELGILLEEYNNEHMNKLDYIGLINKICKNEINDLQSLSAINVIDPNRKLLKDIPILCIYHYIYNYIHRLQPLVMLAKKNGEPLDQDFINTKQLLEKIASSNDLLNKLNKVFPIYHSLDGQTLKADFKRVHAGLTSIDKNRKQRRSGDDTTSLFSVGMYTRKELQKYFDCLQQVIDQCPKKIQDTVQFLTFTTSHTISVGYDYRTSKWYIVDSLNLTKDNIVTGLDKDEVAERLCIYHSNGDCAGFIH